MHIRNAACIAVGVAFRVVVVALVVAQPAADARSRRTHRTAGDHDASMLPAFALGFVFLDCENHSCLLLVG